MSRRVLVVDDDRDLAHLVELHLGDLGSDVKVAHDGHDAAQILERESFDLVVLDLMLPGIEGIELCRRLRAREDYTAILMLTAKSTELDRVLGLEVGADDYLTKPFSVLELRARVKALFRRVEAFHHAPEPAEPDGLLESEGLSIDLNRRTVRLRGETVDLTAREFDLLAHFARNPGIVFTRAQLLDSVWGYGHKGYEHTVNSHINRLRTKIEEDPSNPRLVLTVWGVGYKFRDSLS